MCVGGVETSVPAFQKLTKYLNDQHYSNLQIESRVLENTGHSGTKGEGYARGLQFVFKRPSIQLSEAALQSYIGKYQLSNGSTVEMKKENNQLVLYPGGSERIPLYAASEKELYATSGFLTIKVKWDDDKKITGADVETYGGTVSAKKL
jgi:hypothetical protein